jgi:hypothetical protein
LRPAQVTDRRGALDCMPRRLPIPSSDTSSLDDLHQNHDDGEYQEDMNKSTHRV